MMASEPPMGLLVMDVIRPGQGHEKVDIQEGGHASSSRASRTRSEVMAGAVGDTSNTGNPERKAGSLGRKARRTNSEITCPSVLPSDTARFLTARKMSSSILMVV